MAKTAVMSLRALLFPACALLFVWGCSDDGGGTSPAPAGTANGTDGGTSNTAPANVAVEYGGKTVTVDVAALARLDYKGSSVVSLSKVWDSAKLEADLGKVEFDFEGDDGFRPTTRDRCKTKITGAQIAQGYVLPETRTLVWDEALGLPGCYGVKGVAKVIVTDK